MVSEEFLFLGVMGLLWLLLLLLCKTYRRQGRGGLVMLWVERSDPGLKHPSGSDLGRREVRSMMKVISEGVHRKNTTPSLEDLLHQTQRLGFPR